MRSRACIPVPRIRCFCACGLLIVVTSASAEEIRFIAPVRIQQPPRRGEYRPVFSAAELGESLLRFRGAECDPGAIQESLARRYRFLGYVPTIDVSCEEGTLAVSLRESSQTIEVIAFDPADLGRLDVGPNPAFEETRALYPVQAGPTRAVLRGLLRTREGDLYNHERYRSESDALRRLGYAIAVIPGGAQGEGAYPRAAYLVQSLVPAEDARRRTRPDSNYLGGTGSYGPRRRTSIGVLYQKDGLLRTLDRLSIAPNYNASVGGDLSYVAPLLAAREQPERLYDLELRLYSDFSHNRLLGGVETDQRNSGFSTTLGIRPLGLAGPHVLRFPLGLRYERVDLEEAIPGADENRLSMLQLGAEYEWHHTDRWPSLTVRLAPTIDFAFNAAGGQRSFVRPGVDANLHGRLLTGLEIDLHLLGGTLDRQVPLFELWSLGGSGTVRGFGEDSFLGRHLAALQAELWIPFVGQSTYEPRPARLLKAALFMDGGYLSGTSTGRNEAIAGGGAGLRFLVPRRPLVLRLDYGWGFAGDGGESHPYVSIAYHP